MWVVLLACGSAFGCGYRVPVSAGDGPVLPDDGPQRRNDSKVPLDSGPPEADANRVAAAFIFVVDAKDNLRRYHPLTNRFSLVGRLGCRDSGTPFSMAVQRSGRAWVLYSSGNIFWVDTSDASCKPSSYKVDQAGLHLFGMSFAADDPSAASETLYIAGDFRYPDPARLVAIDPATLDARPVGKLTLPERFSPELTGTRDGELFAYFPGTAKARVAAIDKRTAKTTASWSVTPSKGSPSAWAFAHWGGKFYIFITAGGDARVLRLDPDTGRTAVMHRHLPFRVVGAGVSTFAPVETPDMGIGAVDGGAPSP